MEGTGSTVSGGGLSGSAKIRSISGGPITIDALETTDMENVDSRTFIPGKLVNPGQFTVEVFYNGEEPDIIAQAGAEKNVQADLTDVVVTAPYHTGSAVGTVTWTCKGFVSSFSWTDPVAELQTASITFQLSGLPEVTTS
jgi:hypothetical protein